MINCIAKCPLRHLKYIQDPQFRVALNVLAWCSSDDSLKTSLIQSINTNFFLLC